MFLYKINILNLNKGINCKNSGHQVFAQYLETNFLTFGLFCADGSHENKMVKSNIL